MKPWLLICQFFAALVLALVAGSVFGIWRGYDPTALSPSAFIEMHQGAVRGLNMLLPAMGFVSIALTLVLVLSARRRGRVVRLYLSALLLMVAAGVTTRFFNQPINALVMGWTAETFPDTWSDLRAQWWTWHLWRTAFSVSALSFLLAAIVLDRPARS